MIATGLLATPTASERIWPIACPITPPHCALACQFTFSRSSGFQVWSKKAPSEP